MTLRCLTKGNIIFAQLACPPEWHLFLNTKGITGLLVSTEIGLSIFAKSSSTLETFCDKKVLDIYCLSYLNVHGENV